MDQPIVNHTDSRPVFLDTQPQEDKEGKAKYRNNLISNVLSLDPSFGYNYRPDLTEESDGQVFWNKARVDKATNDELVVLTTHIENAMDVLKSGGIL